MARSVVELLMEEAHLPAQTPVDAEADARAAAPPHLAQQVSLASLSLPLSLSAGWLEVKNSFSIPSS